MAAPSTDWIREDIQTAIAAFNKEWRKSATRSHYASITVEHWNEINDPSHDSFGCDSHYGPKGHAVLAQDIAPQLEATGWSNHVHVEIDRHRASRGHVHLHTQHDSYVGTVRAYSTRYELELHTRMSNAQSQCAATGRDREIKLSLVRCTRSGRVEPNPRYDRIGCSVKLDLEVGDCQLPEVSCHISCICALWHTSSTDT